MPTMTELIRGSSLTAAKTETSAILSPLAALKIAKAPFFALVTCSQFHLTASIMSRTFSAVSFGELSYVAQTMSDSPLSGYFAIQNPSRSWTYHQEIRDGEIRASAVCCAMFRRGSCLSSRPATNRGSIAAGGGAAAQPTADA